MMSLDKELRRDIRWYTSKLGEMVKEQAGPARFKQVEKLRTLSKAVRQHHRADDIQAKRNFISRLSLDAAYDLAHSFSLFFQLVNLCEERARIRGIKRKPGLRQSLRAMFDELRERGVAPREIQACLDQLEVEPVLTAHPTESKRRTVLSHLLRLGEAPEDQVDEILEALWQTEEVRDTKVTPINEIDNVLFLFERTIFDAGARFYRTFDEELQRAYPTVKRNRYFLSFGSWVGGDRDGNPFVTPEVSKTAMSMHREEMLAYIREQLDKLVEEISHSSGPVTAGKSGHHGFHHRETNRTELADLLKQLGKPELTAGQLAARLEQVQESLLKQGAVRAAKGRLQDLIHVVHCFGFHLAHLDFRDHSGRVESEQKTIAAELRALKNIQKLHGEQAGHRFILSMTHSARDIDRLLRQARKAGTTSLDLVPLLETIADLNGGADLLRSMWANKEYRKHLAQRGNIQEVMMGYSDSNKDGGYLAANWMLFKSQRAIAEAGDEHGVQVRFFHGKGGSIDRGGGMSHKSLQAQPHAAHGARLRITEQGEVIAFKYGNPEIAQRNLEQLTTAVISTHCLKAEKQYVEPEWESAMGFLSDVSFEHYQELVYRTPEFPDYFWSATPIDLIEHLRIGSRPAKRFDSREIIQLRAIPWVFSWTQSRHMLPAWYGIGTALESFAREQGGLEELQEMYRDWPYFHMLLQNAQVSLGKVDLYIASRYADLVKNSQVREKIFGMIEEEYRRSKRWVNKVAGQKSLLSEQPRLVESIRMRNPYVDPLHYIQLRYLQTWRAGSESKRTEAMRRLLALTVNGIAFGMKSTG